MPQLAIPLAIAGSIASIGGTVMSFMAQRDAAKQAEMNAAAQNQAIQMERLRKNQETAENMRRQSREDKRFRAQQMAEISASGLVPTIGTPLDLLADTAVKQQRQMADLAYGRDVTDRDLAYEGESALAMGAATASNRRSEAGATLLSGAANALSNFSQIKFPKAGRP